MRRWVLAGLMLAVASSSSLWASQGKRPVCLLSDLGTDDFYLGALKGSVLQKNPDAIIHDINHNLPAYDIQTSAFLIHQSTALLPAGSIIVAVVDPTVGTMRRNMALKTRRGLIYVGPDNGIFTWVIKEQGLVEAHDITHPSTRLDVARSTTFHARDIYGPAAGWLSSGHDISEIGNPIRDPVQFALPVAELKDAAVVGQVMWVDHFGNILTNIPKAMMEGALQADPADAQRKTLQVRFAGGTTAFFPQAPTYATVKEKTEVSVVNSLGWSELALNQGNAAQKYAVKPGQRVEFLLRK